MSWWNFTRRRKNGLLYLYVLVLSVMCVFYYMSIKRVNDLESGAVERVAYDDDIPPVVQTMEKKSIKREDHVLYDGINPFEDYKKLPKKDWHDHGVIKADALRTGPGEGGVPLVLDSESDAEKKRRDDIFLDNGFDAVFSDMIALNRSLKDLRHRDCMNVNYTSKLPSVSVIVPYHNEHNSTLLRTVISVVKMSPPDVLHEIILVDDDSNREYLMGPLDDYFRQHGLHNLVKVIRPHKRHGLIRARQIGAQAATGEILIFLDSHSEALPNWIPPLVEPIVEDYRTVVCPFIDVIDCKNFEYRPQDQGMRGSFAWNFDYKRLPLRKGDQKSPTSPFESPVMAGGYFAISAKWFWELGGYDEGLDIWGGEQYELSFKVWQCHGRMLDAPCSRVGHIYRCKRRGEATPHGFGDYLSRNYRRVAEVWMDEYKEHLFARRPGIKHAQPGDLTLMMDIRKKLQCKSFDWFMKNIANDQDFYYPAVEPKPSAEGELRNLGNNLCLDSGYKSDGEPLQVRACIKDTKEDGEQRFKLTHYLDLRTARREKCLDLPDSRDKAAILLYHCHMGKGNQLFRYRSATKQVFHPVSGMCMDADAATGTVFGRRCDSAILTQKWKWESIDEALIKQRDGNDL